MRSGGLLQSGGLKYEHTSYNGGIACLLSCGVPDLRTCDLKGHQLLLVQNIGSNMLVQHDDISSCAFFNIRWVMRCEHAFHP